VTVHELSDDDEFLVIACDGTCFRDCLLVCQLATNIGFQVSGTVSLRRLWLNLSVAVSPRSKSFTGSVRT
jgi:hypothetical protein